MADTPRFFTHVPDDFHDVTFVPQSLPGVKHKLNLDTIKCDFTGSRYNLFALFDKKENTWKVMDAKLLFEMVNLNRYFEQRIKTLEEDMAKFLIAQQSNTTAPATKTTRKAAPKSP